MNALNILSAISPTPQHPKPGSASGSTAIDDHSSELGEENREKGTELDQKRMGTIVKEEDATPLTDEITEMETSEHAPLLSEWEPEKHVTNKSWNSWRSFPARVTSAVVGSVKIVFTYIAAPFRYVITYFVDEQGRISPVIPVLAIARAINPNKRRRSMQANNLASHSEKTDTSPAHAADANLYKTRSTKIPKRSLSMTSSSTAISTDSEPDEKAGNVDEDSPAQNTRSKSTPAPDGGEIAPSRRSIRIKLHNEQVSKRRKKQEAKAREKENPKEEEVKELVAASLKSPSGASAAVKLTRFPRAPMPPRPLVPRRQPSYTKVASMNHSRHTKTLILDLDETLIHSHSKGGRFASGHMVEVKMQHAVGVGGVTIGPQVPILYYVHKRPHCDDFLRKVSKWYNLVIFTASVQEYADPVIDWLEIERPYFSARYYRQHCTTRNGAYIKDLSQVEADLSKVMIVDNSPVSYIFHEDNAIPIEGWISDPTDNDLLHLIPLLEGLQYATDVRAILSLRLGQPDSVVV